jgi:hypothetical protein
MRARAATFDAAEGFVPPKAPRPRPQLAPLGEEPTLLELPPRVPVAKLEEVWAKRNQGDAEAVLSSSAPGDFAPRIWEEEPPVEDFMLDGFEDDGDGCVFAMDDEGEEEDTKFTLEPAAMVEEEEESAAKVRTASAASTAASELDAFSGSPVLHACLVDIHREKRRTAAALVASA